MAEAAPTTVEKHLQDEYGIEGPLAKNINAVMMRIGIPLEGTIFGISNGYSCVIVPADGAVVYQVYSTPETCAKIMEFHSAIGSCDHVVKIRDFISGNNCIVFDKIRPLNSIFPEMIHESSSPRLRDFIAAESKKLRGQITAAIECISSRGWAHGDVTLDNIGLDSDGNFVLYDFDSVEKSTDGGEGDFSRFEGSIRFRSGGARQTRRKRARKTHKRNRRRSRRIGKK